MAIKAKKKPAVCLTFWSYDAATRYDDRLDQAGELTIRDDGSYMLIVKRGEQEEQARALIQQLTAEGVVGQTKIKPVVPSAPRPSRSRGRGRRQEVSDRELNAAIAELFDGEIERILRQGITDLQMSDMDFFLSVASSGTLMVSLNLEERYGASIFSQLVEYGLVGDAFWDFYRGECFDKGNEDADPIAKMKELLDSGKAAELATKYNID